MTYSIFVIVGELAFVNLYHTWADSANNKLVIFFFFFFFQKLGIDISSKLSLKTMGNGMSDALFWKNRKKYFQISSVEMFTQHPKD